MKQIFKALFITLLLTSCQYKEEAFVNPLFYEKMESLSDLWDVTITPKTFDMKNREYDDAEIWHEDCEMWENTPTKVVLRCTHQLTKLQLAGLPKNRRVTEEHSTREIMIRPPEEQIYEDGVRMVMYEYYEDEENWISRLGYLIRTSKE